MAEYVVLGNYTSKGKADLKSSPGRIESLQSNIAALGGSIKDVYFTMGQYDFVVVFEFPDDEAMMKFLMQVGTQGYVETVAMRAFSLDQASEMIAGLN